MRLGDSLIWIEEDVSALRLRSGGRGVAPVSGIKRCAQIDEQRSGGEGSRRRGARSTPMQEGDSADWHQRTVHLYDALVPKLTGFLRHLGLRRDDREDVIQEVFLRLAEHLRDGNNANNLHAWAHQVAHNLAMDIHRLHWRGKDAVDLELEPEAEPIDPDADPERVYVEKELSGQLRTAMAQLTRQQYSSILLRTQGRRLREIGEVLGVSEQRAGVLVRRGMEILMEVTNFLDS